MKPKLYLVQSSILSPVAKAFGDDGILIDKFLKEIGLGIDSLKDQHSPIGKINHFWKFYQNVEKAADRDDLGFMLSDHLSIEDVGALGCEVSKAVTLYEALQLSSSFLPKFVQGTELNITHEDDVVHLDYSRQHDGVCKTADQITVQYTLNLLKHIEGEHSPLSVAYQSEEPACKSNYGEMGCPISFGENRTRITLPKIALAESISLPRATELGYFQATDLPTPENLKESLFAVLQTIISSGAYMPSAEEAAQLVDVSPAKLKRTLNAEQSSYAEIKVRASIAKAKELLVSDSVSIKEVSHLLGYTSPSNFTRAFKKATGMTPREFQFLS